MALRASSGLSTSRLSGLVKAGALVGGKKLVLIGDSQTQQNNLYSGSNRNNNRSMKGWLNWYDFLNGHPFYHPCAADNLLAFDTGSVSGTGRLVGMNNGIGGDHTLGMKNRYAVDVLTKVPDIIIGHGGTNDINSGVAATTVFANVRNMIDRGIDAGALAVWQTVFPRSTEGGGSDFSAAQKLVRARYNDMLRDYGLRTKNLIVVDHDILMTDPATGMMRATYTQDGLHVKTLGAYIQYLGMEAALRDIIPPSFNGLAFDPNNLYDATNNPQGNLLPNPLLAGTGGQVGTGVTGSVADSWRVERASGTGNDNITATCSKGTRTLESGVTIPTQLVTVTCDGLGSSATQTMRIRPTTQVIATGAATGIYLESCGYIKIGASTGTHNILGMYGTLQEGTSGAAMTMMGKGDSGDLFLNQAVEGMFKSDPLLLTGITGFRFDWRVEMPGNVANSITLDLSSLSVRSLMTAPPYNYSA